MELIPISFLGGLLTVLAPCVFPLLPVIIGGSMGGKGLRRPVIIISSLAVSVILFTLLLRATTALIGIHPQVWKSISGGIIIIFGLAYLFPLTWNKLMHWIGFEGKAQENLQKANQKDGTGGLILMGMALGPVFSSCSPTYALVLATVLPTSFAVGMLNLLAYTLGLVILMFLVAFLGQKLVKKMRWAVDPQGTFRKVLGVLFLIVGIAVLFGLDKTFEAWVLDQGYFDLTFIEQNLLEGRR